MTPSPQQPDQGAADPIDELLSQYHIVKYENIGKSETDWYELAQDIRQLLLQARIDELEQYDATPSYEAGDAYVTNRLKELKAAQGGGTDA